MKLMAIVTKKGYRDPRWCTAKQLFEKGYHIKAGEHGTICEKWIFEKEKKTKDAHGNTIKEIVQLDRPQVMYFRVFMFFLVHNKRFTTKNHVTLL